MKWLVNLFKKKKEQKKQNIEIPREIGLTDYKGQELICELCGNEDNETGEYFPITKENKRKWKGRYWHKNCLRFFLREVKKGNFSEWY